MISAWDGGFACDCHVPFSSCVASSRSADSMYPSQSGERSTDDHNAPGCRVPLRSPMRSAASA